MMHDPVRRFGAYVGPCLSQKLLKLCVFDWTNVNILRVESEEWDTLTAPWNLRFFSYSRQRAFGARPPGSEEAVPSQFRHLQRLKRVYRDLLQLCGAPVHISAPRSETTQFEHSCSRDLPQPLDIRELRWFLNRDTASVIDASRCQLLLWRF